MDDVIRDLERRAIEGDAAAIRALALWAARAEHVPDCLRTVVLVYDSDWESTSESRVFSTEDAARRYVRDYALKEKEPYDKWVNVVRVMVDFFEEVELARFSQVVLKSSVVQRLAMFYRQKTYSYLRDDRTEEDKEKSQRWLDGGDKVEVLMKCVNHLCPERGNFVQPWTNSSGRNACQNCGAVLEERHQE